MKNFKGRLTALCIACVFLSVAQNNYWTWMNGSSTTVSTSPVYGTLSVPATTNSPGSRRSTITITDNNGNLWLFGGYNQSLAGYMADLWKYNISNNTWVWMSGPGTPSSTGVYGTLGVSSSANYPGSRYAGCGWADNNGNLWIFGGYGYSSVATLYYLNDLWKYNISSGQWTWMGGSSTNSTYGTYGTMGTSAPMNKPGGRYMASSFKDGSGNLWLFGGSGLASGTGGSLSDLWKYSPSSNTWTWMKGSPVSNQFSVYGTQGAASASNTPGGRYGAAGSIDTAGNFYLFSGYGMINNGTGYMNDLWKYSVSTGNWTFLNGSVIANQSGVYGTQGVSSPSTSPGSRFSYANNSMTDGGGNFLVFGGYGYSGGGAGYLNDLWRYNVATGQWVWLKGSMFASQYGQYGTQGTGGSLNNPGSRYYHSTWRDNSGYFWIYGGYGFSSTTTGELSDLWKLDLCSIPNVPATSTPSVNLTKCSGSTTTLTVASGTIPVQWYASSTSTGVLGTGTTFVTPSLNISGTSTVFVFYAEAFTCGASATRAAIGVTVNPTPTITVNSGTLCAGTPFAISPSGAATYTYSGGAQVVSPATNTSYTVSGTSAQGCASTVSAISNITVFPSPTLAVNSGSICPGQAFTITPTGAVSYTYSGGPIVSPTATAVYFITGSSALGCTSPTPAISVVVVNQSPVITVNSGTVCSGAAFSMTPSGAATYTFSSGSPVVYPQVSTSYTVTGTSGQGCASQNTAVSNVTVVPSPTVSVTGGSICAGSFFTLVASGAVSYTYNNSTQVVSPTITTTYSVNGLNQAGCQSANPGVATVVVFPRPVISVNSGAICKGQIFSIVPNGAVSYTYSGGPVVNPLVTTSYSITGSSAQGCVSASPAICSVTVNALPVIAVNASTPVCAGQPVTLTATGAASYTYSGIGASSIISSGVCSFTPIAPVGITVKGTSAEGCVDSVSFNLNVGICNSISEIEGIKYSIYPNPTYGPLIIQVSGMTNVLVYDALGQLIINELINGKKTIELSGYPRGIYSLVLQKGNSRGFYKVIRE